MNLGLIYKRQQHSPGLKEQRKMQMDRRDINQNYLLDIGEAWRYVASGAVSLGQQTNLGSVSAIAVDPNGVPLGIPPVTDTDPANYLGVIPTPI
jgi:hypothetical protein